MKTTRVYDPSNLRNEPQYRIYWRVGANGQPHRSDGVFGRDVAELWVGSLNGDKDNRAVGLFYWMEAEPAEGDGRLAYSRKEE